VSVRRRTTCRICDGPLTAVLSLGAQPLANRLPRPEEAADVATYPLTMSRCDGCGLVQLLEAVPTAELFSDYAYVPSTSSTMRDHFAELASTMVDRLALTARDLVIDVGSNDGLFLSHVQRVGPRVHGVEVAENLARQANAAGIPTTAAALDQDVARRTVSALGRARLVTATNVFAHVDDVRGFLRAALDLLTDDGVFVVEVQSFADTARALAFDMTYHEHMSYFATRPLRELCRRTDCALLDVERVDTHGGSLRATIGRSGHPLHRPARVEQRVADEEPWVGVAGCQTFARGCERLRDELRALLRGLRSAGETVAAYGAPAKATVLLNYCGFGREDIAYVVDRNPAKQDRVIPGVRIPVVSPERLRRDPPTHLLLLAWNLADEIMREQAAFRAAGGRFVRPLPMPAIVP
jgi:novobiocin biosynthesis protein NovU/D-mycarose 3-C-methyltransferase